MWPREQCGAEKELEGLVRSAGDSCRSAVALVRVRNDEGLARAGRMDPEVRDDVETGQRRAGVPGQVWSPEWLEVRRAKESQER